MAQATWSSTAKIFSMLVGSIKGEVIRFSTARTTPKKEKGESRWLQKRYRRGGGGGGGTAVIERTKSVNALLDAW